MNFAKQFEDLEIWQESRRLYKVVYKLLEPCRDYSFRDQMQRASLSVMNNISEGFERRTAKDFAHFLDLAKASAGEVRSMAYAGEDVGIMNQSDAKDLRDGFATLSKRIAAFQRHLRKP
ncbi:MAG: four helix bundle protein [Verrucomicrobia bacterium]|nr:four helix bundle protein [Verrucomicrobiota bacterium]